jgi:hypothetical protein
MNTRRLQYLFTAISVMASAMVLTALTHPAAAQSEACVHLQVGSGYAATMQVNFDGTPPRVIGPSDTFDIGATQCLSLADVPNGGEFSVQVNAILGESAICNPPNIPRSAASPTSVTFNASGTVDNVHCDMPTGGTRATSKSR